MIIIQLAGGLGNQLQQYALYRKFVSMGVEARVDTSWFEQEEDAKRGKDLAVTRRKLELDYFDRILYEVCTKEEKEALIGGDGLFGKLRRKLLPWSVRWFHESQIYHPELLSFRDMYLSGYFACEKYYADILYDLRQKIQFPMEGNLENARLAEEMEGCESVSVHIRRGDYLNPENAQMFGNICTREYYDSAMDAIRKKCRNPRFYIFSDDPDYARAHDRGTEFTIVDINHGEDSFLDIYLMSHCRHNICANSTFSFWGARLNGYDDKIMIRPTVHKNSQVFVKEEMEKLWEGWMFISPKGEIQ